MNLRSLYLTTIVGLVLAACGKGNGKETPEAGFSAADLEGTWTQSCAAATFIQGTYYGTGTLTINGGAFTRSTTYWKDSSCQVPVYEITQAGNLTIGASRDGQSRDAVFAATKTSGKSNDSQIVEALNFLQICQRNDWVAASEQDLTSGVCNTVSNWGRNINGVRMTESGQVFSLDLIGPGAQPSDEMDRYMR